MATPLLSDNFVRRLAHSVVLTTVATLPVALAQSTTPDSLERTLVGRAETEGRAFSQVNSQSIPSSFIGARGSPARTCTVVPAQRRISIANMGLSQDRRAYRSGEFVVGGLVEELRAGKQAKVWWTPQLNSANMPPLTLVGRSLTNPKDTFRFTTRTVSSSRQPDPQQREYSFTPPLVLPRSGKWLVTAESGANWGCFVFTATPG